MLILKFRGAITNPADSTDCEIAAGSLSSALAGETPQFTGVLLGDGTAAAPSLTFASLPTLGLYKANTFGFGGVGAGVTSAYFSFGGAGAIQQNSAGVFSWTATADAVGGTADLVLARDAANILAQRNGTNAQTFRVYGNATGSKYLQLTHNGTDGFLTTSSGRLFFGFAGGNKWLIDETTGALWANTDNAVDIGATAANRPRDYFGAGKITTIGATSGIGYATGAGGAVTQLTSRATTVILNTVTGDITLFSAAGSATAASFTVTNSAVAATDNIVINQKSGTDLYNVLVTNVAAGSFKVTFFTTGGTTTEQPVFHFSVIKGVNA